jgi:predicted transcriptional regulator
MNTMEPLGDAPLPHFFKRPEECRKCEFSAIFDETGQFTCVAPACHVPLEDLDLELLHYLERRPETRGVLVQKSHRPRTTIFDSLRRLMLRGFVKPVLQVKTGNRGRPEVLFKLVEAGQ